MKKSLFSILFLGMSAIVASAQNVFPTPSVSLTSETPIALSSPKADIMGQSYTTDFTTLESPQTLFTTTTAEASHQRHTDGQRRKFRPHLAGIADIGIGTALGFNLTIGSQLTSFFYLGAGLNTIYWHDGFVKQNNRADIHAIINPRFEIPFRSNIIPFVDLKTGIAATHKHGALVSLSTGVQLDQFIIGVGYTIQTTNEEYTDFTVGSGCLGTYYTNYTYDGLSLRLGLKF